MENQAPRRNGLTLPVILLALLFLITLPGFGTIHAQEAEKPCLKPYIKTLSPKAARPGDEIKIRGSRFGKKQGTVTFTPGVKAPVTEWDFKRIFVIVPDGAKTGPVFLEAACGETSNESYFTVKTEEE